MNGTRKEWIAKAKSVGAKNGALWSAADGYNPAETWEGLADLAEEHGGPFEPEPPPVEVVWEDLPPAPYSGMQLRSDGSWWTQGRDNAGRLDGEWEPVRFATIVHLELGNRLLAEWRARQGPGDWADAAAREAWETPHQSVSGWAAIVRRHGDALAAERDRFADLLNARNGDVRRLEGRIADLQALAGWAVAKVVAWLRAAPRVGAIGAREAQNILADAIERGEHL